MKVKDLSQNALVFLDTKYLQTNRHKTDLDLPDLAETAKLFIVKNSYNALKEEFGVVRMKILEENSNWAISKKNLPLQR